MFLLLHIVDMQAPIRIIEVAVASQGSAMPGVLESRLGLVTESEDPSPPAASRPELI
jgi:hypothetical protein